MTDAFDRPTGPSASTPSDPADPALRLAAQVEMFSNRLRKTLRHLSKWARKEGIECFRVYDADIPEVPLAVDRYADHAHVALYLGAHAPPPALAEAWLAAMADAVARVLAIDPAHVHVKGRAPQAGAAQYEKLADTGRRFPVREAGLTFLVNLDDYVDSGLFLDHRPMRAMVAAESAGKDVLNLFAYTGAFTVHAAGGGARSTTTVDMSQTYLDWARDNLAANRLDGPEHRFIRADILAWLEDEPATPAWDLVVLDPPTFSNSKKMRQTLDIQRDHAALLNAVMARVRPGGVVYFSTNFRKFKPVPEAFAQASRVEEISARTVPPDFRDKKIHRAWRLVRRA